METVRPVLYLNNSSGEIMGYRIVRFVSLTQSSITAIGMKGYCLSPNYGRSITGLLVHDKQII